MKKALIILVIVLLFFNGSSIKTVAETSSTTGEYTSKDEVVYVNLHANGQTKNMYVVNSFDVIGEGKIIDYGKYVDVKNLTDLTTITQENNDEIHLQANGEKFFYQGELEKKSLPWDIAITYLLNGKEIDPSELPGESGQLELRIETTANKDVNSLFFEHFLLQISLTLDPEIFHDIQAPKGTEANEGKNKQITFTVLPEQEDVLIVAAQVTDLEMDPINIAAIPANIAIEDPDVSEMTEEMGGLSQAIGELHAGVTTLSKGARELNDGASELSKGSTIYLNGMNELDQSSNGLVNGSKEIRDALRKVSKSMKESPEIDIPDLNDLQEVPLGLRDLANDLRDFSSFLEDLDTSIDDIPMDIDEEQLHELHEVIKESDLDEQIIKQLEKSYEVVQMVKEINQDIPDHIIENISDVSDHIETLADQMEKAMKELNQLDSLEELQTGLTTLASEYESFHTGLISYTSGVHSLATSYYEIDTGIDELSTGVGFVNKGVSDLYEGTKELQHETNGLPNEIQSKIDEFMEEYDFSSFEPASFVSDQNEKVEVVQFVLQTERLKVEEPKEVIETKKETKNLWTRFLDLFK